MIAETATCGAHFNINFVSMNGKVKFIMNNIVLSDFMTDKLENISLCKHPFLHYFNCIKFTKKKKAKRLST